MATQRPKMPKQRFRIKFECLLNKNAGLHDPWHKILKISLNLHQYQDKQLYGQHRNIILLV